MTPARRTAVVTGLLYLLTHVTSVGAAAFYAVGLPTPAIPALDRGSVLIGITLEYLLALGCIGTGVLVARLLHAYGPASAATFSALRGLEAAVILVGTVPMLALVTLDRGATLPAATLAEWGLAATDLHAGFFLIGQGLPIAVNTVVLGALLVRSGVVPRALGILAIAGGVIVGVSDLAQLWGVIPGGGPLAGIGAVPIFAFELWWAGYLIFRGLRAVPVPTPAVESREATVAA